MSIIENALKKAAKQGLVVNSETVEPASLDVGKKPGLQDIDLVESDNTNFGIGTKVVADRQVVIDW
ncbi:hypothetical protein [Methylomonas koyamae]|uniref:hypothetical protein n=1 Tax=Methylomonas koyamae TaxID=702114 RepID=UPI0021B39471|nr:hypothetical protein [Methylomonas koyamae]